jgi:hypothetical protein
MHQVIKAGTSQILPIYEKQPVECKSKIKNPIRIDLLVQISRHIFIKPKNDNSGVDKATFKIYCAKAIQAIT